MILPGVGSIVVMDDWTGAITTWTLMGVGVGGVILLASNGHIGGLLFVGAVTAISGYVYGAFIRPFTYDKPSSENTAYRNEGFNFTAMPNRHGNFTPAVIYNKAF